MNQEFLQNLHAILLLRCLFLTDPLVLHRVCSIALVKNGIAAVTSTVWSTNPGALTVGMTHTSDVLMSSLSSSFLPYQWDVGPNMLMQPLPVRTIISCFNDSSKIQSISF